MANNRMHLKNKRTGAEILLAKYFPGSGWYVFYEDLAAQLNQILAANEPEPSQWGDNDWVIEYEMIKGEDYE